MCGIVGYIGYREAYPIVIKGLKRLEYRGYDSAGVMIYDGDVLLCKTKGKVVDLKKRKSNEMTSSGTIGIGHTRWATHGVPNDVNSHPHLSNSGDLVIIHNGIIENYAPLKVELIKRGYVFHSDTDTEVLVNLIEEVRQHKRCCPQNVSIRQWGHAIAAFDKVQMKLAFRTACKSGRTF
jgi:glucosamine--fructose-6-phosphate aminotransferase (isomerizing)